MLTLCFSAVFLHVVQRGESKLTVLLFDPPAVLCPKASVRPETKGKDECCTLQ